MRALVVYESMFGNTRDVAQAIAEGVATSVPVDVREVGQAPPLGELEVDLVLVGAPTHAFSLSRPSSRKDAGARTGHAVISASRGVREWLAETARADLRFVTFETHIRRPNLPGSAARAAAHRLRRLGCTALERPTIFYVEDVDGPLSPGELERATAWGSHLGRRLAGAG